jgi:hypothetical protein
MTSAVVVLDAATMLGLEEEMSPTLSYRYMSDKVFAKAMPLVRISRIDGVHWLFAGAFFIHADKESS